MSKILKSEGRSQDKLLKSSIKELSRLESVQKKAAKVRFATVGALADPI